MYVLMCVLMYVLMCVLMYVLIYVLIVLGDPFLRDDLDLAVLQLWPPSPSARGVGQGQPHQQERHQWRHDQCRQRRLAAGPPSLPGGWERHAAGDVYL